MIGLESSSPQFQCDPSIAITTLMLNTNLLDHFSLLEVLLRLTRMVPVIVIIASGEARYYQKQCQWVFPPQFRDNSYLLPLSRFSRSATKAFNFFRYSFSARRYKFSSSSSSSLVLGGLGFDVLGFPPFFLSSNPFIPFFKYLCSHCQIVDDPLIPHCIPVSAQDKQFACMDSNTWYFCSAVQ